MARAGSSLSVPRANGGAPAAASASTLKAPLRGALVLGAASEAELRARLQGVKEAAAAGHAPAPAPPREADLRAAERLAIDYESAAELAEKAGKALAAFDGGSVAVWRALRAQGIFRGSGPAPKVAFLYTGQGSQYVNMLRALRSSEPVVQETFAEADRVMTPLLGRPLSEYIFVDPADAAAVAQAEEDLKQTAITQPAVLATDIALTRLLAAYGIAPDMVMGHSLGEYAALVAAGALPFADALEAVSARGREMTRVSVEDNGKMAAVFAPVAEIEKTLAGIDGYLVIANYNSRRQAVIGGASAAVVDGGGRLHEGRDPGRAPPREPCLPHPDRGPGLRAPAPHPRAPAHRAAPAAGGRERHRRLLRHGPGRAAAHPRGAESAGGFPGAVREGARDPARRRA